MQITFTEIYYLCMIIIGVISLFLQSNKKSNRRPTSTLYGDYFNDYEMLKAVALPACCGQAPRGMKEIAKLVTCHCDRGAVADLIEYITEHYAK